MASNIFWLVVTMTLLPLVTYWLFNPLFSPPRNRTKRLERQRGALHQDQQARLGPVPVLPTRLTGGSCGRGSAAIAGPWRRHGSAGVSRSS
jgi:hypothetical protein